MSSKHVDNAVAQVNDDAWSENKDDWGEFKPLSEEQAKVWRQQNPLQTPWRLVGLQWLVGAVVVLLTYLLASTAQWAPSLMYGVVSMAVPSTVMAYGMTSNTVAKLMPGVSKASLAGFAMWEAAKLLLAIALMAMAPKVVVDLNWLAFVAGVVVVLKAYWLELYLRVRVSRRAGVE